MQKVNILVPDLGASQLGFSIIKNINNWYRNASNNPSNNNIDFLVFYENMHRYCVPPEFAIFNIAEAWGQSGTTIATTYNTGRQLANMPGSTKKILYLWDLEWKRHNLSYDVLTSVYLNTDLDIVCRSEEHATLFKNCFNRSPIGIVDDFNLVEFGALLW